MVYLVVLLVSQLVGILSLHFLGSKGDIGPVSWDEIFADYFWEDISFLALTSIPLTIMIECHFIEKSKRQDNEHKDDTNNFPEKK